MNANQLKISQRVIGCAMSVSNTLGAGFLEAVYANALALELAEQELAFERESALPVCYKNSRAGIYYADFLVETRLVVELKALSRLTSEHEAQVINYLRASGISVGLLLNFGTPRLDFKRLVWGHDDSQLV
ncbi:MAG TPA: GxxExxY protein [Rhodanobacteraceae bacterium]|nr:GxxExxY protein [Rhodanobacteraceae bacterium]